MCSCVIFLLKLVFIFNVIDDRSCNHFNSTLIISFSISSHGGPLGSFAKLKAVFSFRRRLDYYISAVYVPEVILVGLSWCTFFITPTAVPARISLSITTILTTILLSSSLNNNIPKVNFPPWRFILRGTGAERWTCIPVLTANRICSRYIRAQVLYHACKIVNWFASYQMGFLNLLCSILIIYLRSLSLKSPIRGEVN